MAQFQHQTGLENKPAKYVYLQFFTVLNLKSGNKLITHQVDTFMMLTISLVVKSIIDFPKLFVSFEYNQIIHNKTLFG